MYCRLCDSKIDESSFVIKNLPKAAQWMPSIAEFQNDIPTTLTLFECNNCSLTQISNNPVDYYKDVITTGGLSETSKKEIEKEIEKLEINSDDTKFLEIGAGKGDNLTIFKKLGFKITAIENNINSVKTIQKSGFRVLKGYLLDDNFELDEKFDFIYINNFLEHQPSISNFLKKVRVLLKNTSLLYISVPSLNQILKKKYLYEFVCDHLVYFNEHTLKLALNMNGFEIIESDHKNNNNDLVAICRAKVKTNYNIIYNDLLKIIDHINIFINSQKNKTISIWGAGHRALALMAIVKTNSLKWVIDSADFKQGRYTPIKHIQIISPESFLKSPTDIIICMLPGSLNNQAIRYLTDYNYEGNIFLFNDVEITEIK